MVTAYKPWFMPISFDGVDKDTAETKLPEILVDHRELGGFDPRTGKLTPFRNIRSHNVAGLVKEMLDSVTAAIEFGFGTPQMFVADFFSTTDDALAFASALQIFDDDVCVNDRHFYAFIYASGATLKCASTYSHMAKYISDMVAFNEQFSIKNNWINSFNIFEINRKINYLS